MKRSCLFIAKSAVSLQLPHNTYFVLCSKWFHPFIFVPVQTCEWECGSMHMFSSVYCTMVCEFKCVHACVCFSVSFPWRDILPPAESEGLTDDHKVTHLLNLWPSQEAQTPLRGISFPFLSSFCFESLLFLAPLLFCCLQSQLYFVLLSFALIFSSFTPLILPSAVSPFPFYCLTFWVFFLYNF